MIETTPHIQNQTKKRINEIDYLKTLAILLVVFGHFLEAFTCAGGENIPSNLYLSYALIYLYFGLFIEV